MSANDGLALGLIVKEVVDLGYCTVERAHSEAMVGGVQDQVLTHNRQADQAEISSASW